MSYSFSLGQFQKDALQTPVKTGDPSHFRRGSGNRVPPAALGMTPLGDPQGLVKADAVTHGAALRLRRHHHDTVVGGKGPVKRQQPFSVDAVIVGQYDIHDNPSLPLTAS